MTKNSRKKKAIRAQMAATGEPFMEARRRPLAEEEVVDDPGGVPAVLPFPEEGTDECRRWHDAFREGKIIAGVGEYGQEAVLDLNRFPHTLVGGQTRAGKSALLTLVLYGALMNPDVADLIVVDPKVTDFMWARDYPNVRRYAVRDVRTLHEEIHAVSEVAVRAMNARYSLLREHGVNSLSELRRGIANGTITGISLDEVPKRLILTFDEADAVFGPVHDSHMKEKMQDRARANMESVGMLARAMEVNIVMAAQKPSAADIGRTLLAQMGNRVAMGPLKTSESMQVLGTNLAARVPKGATHGRGWLVNDTGEELMFQSYYFLPSRSTRDIPTITGVQERFRTE